MADEPDETYSFKDANASLWVKVSVAVAPGQSIPADHMIVTPAIGTEDDVLVVALDGERRVLRVRQVMNLQGSSPAIPVSVSWENRAEPVEPEDGRKLLAIYDHFDRRSFPE